MGTHPSIKKELLKHIINYLSKNNGVQAKNRKSLTLRIDRSVYELFDQLIRQYGLTSRGRSNVALEALLSFFNESFKNDKIVIQPTINQYFTIQKSTVININRAEEDEEERKFFKMLLKCLDDPNYKFRPEALVYHIEKAKKYLHIPEAKEFLERVQAGCELP